MKHAPSWALVFSAAGMIALAAGPAWAATAAGPYYATPSWDQTLPSSTRFIVLSNMNSEAVLDRETGLVWEQTPSTTQRTFKAGQNYCRSLSKGGRKGWRLPAIEELGSLMDSTVQNPSLPSGHPFTDVQSPGQYWSATVDSYTDLNSYAWTASFFSSSLSVQYPVSSNLYVWCVRGGKGETAQPF